MTLINKQNKNIFIAVIIILIIIIIGISVYFIKNNNSLHKYSEETISILEKYKNKELTNKEAKDRIYIIYKDIINIYDKNNDIEYLTFATLINRIETEIFPNDININRIYEYIEELQEY